MDSAASRAIPSLSQALGLCLKPHPSHPHEASSTLTVGSGRTPFQVHVWLIDPLKNPKSTIINRKSDVRHGFDGALP
jgi:hypothetical protein